MTQNTDWLLRTVSQIAKDLSVLKKEKNISTSSTWVKASVITYLTGWKGKELSWARDNDLLQWRINGESLQYKLESLNKIFIKKQNGDLDEEALANQISERVINHILLVLLDKQREIETGIERGLLNRERTSVYITPGEARFFFDPPITFSKLEKLTSMNLLRSYRIGGLIFYKRDEVKSALNIIKNNNLLK